MKLIDILSVLPRVPCSSVSEFPMLDFFIFPSQRPSQIMYTGV